MTTAVLARKRNERTWRASEGANWLGFAASPTFALMAWLAASDTPRIPICSQIAEPLAAEPLATGPLAIDGMASMYLLMCLFHVSPWLRLVFGRPKPINHPASPSEGD